MLMKKIIFRSGRSPCLAGSYLANIVFALLIHYQVATGQSITYDIDSLKNEIVSAPESEAQVYRILTLLEQFQQMRPSEIKAYAEKAKELAIKLNLSEKEAKANYYIAIAYYFSSEPEKGLEPVHRAREILENLENKGEEISDTYNLLTVLYGALDQTEDVLEWAFQNVQLCEERKLNERLAVAYATLGNAYHKVNLEDSAKKYWDIALPMTIKYADDASTGVLYNNLGEINPDPDSAQHYFQESLKIFDQLDYASGKAHARANMANIWLRRRAPSEALQELKIAEDIWKPDHYHEGLALAEVRMARAYDLLGREMESNEHVEKGLQLGRDSCSSLVQLNLLTEWVDHKIGQKDYEGALKYFDTILELKDQIFDQKRAAQLSLAEIKYQTENKEKEIIEQRLTISRQENEQRTLFLGSLLLISLIAGTLLHLRNRAIINRKQAEVALQIQSMESAKLKEIDEVKSTFFANISHEFRTPITLILSPLDQLIRGTLQGDPKDYFAIMQQNANRLLQLVNQLLDLSRLESGKMQLVGECKDLSVFVRGIIHSFENIAQQKNIEIKVETPESLTVFFDQDKVEKIIVNLLSNALKFTPAQGSIFISLKRNENEKTLLVVEDNGCGISTERKENLFERFGFSSESTMQRGSGIGLALSKELTELHGGCIEVQSQENVGTIFTVSLDTSKAFFEEKGKIRMREPNGVSGKDQLAEASRNGREMPEAMLSISEKPLVLIVDDNDDVRRYISDQLRTHFDIQEAVNGREGVELAHENTPDLIITDIMMPEIDGQELCRLIKADEKTSHIPIIMLTAKADLTDKLNGLEEGADDYLVKPFDTRELEIRIRNILENRRKLQEYYRNSLNIFTPLNEKTESLDEQFLRRVRETIENSMESEHFNVTILSHKIGMSRSHLQRKLHALTGYSPNEVIRNMRLEKAHQLLVKKAGTASEVAYITGFSSPSYFSKCFKDYYGVNPSRV